MNELTQTDKHKTPFSPADMEQAMLLANLMSKSCCAIPEHLRNNTGDCLCVVYQAASQQMNPFVLAKRTSIDNGMLVYDFVKKTIEQTKPEWPKNNDRGDSVDDSGTPWNHEFHAPGKGLTSSNEWRLKRGADKKKLEQYRMDYLTAEEGENKAEKLGDDLVRFQGLINNSTSSFELVELKEIISDWGNSNDVDLIAVNELLLSADSHIADWREVEKEEKEKRDSTTMIND